MSVAAIGGVLPPEIQNASTSDQQRYKADLGFERMLIGELTKNLKVSGASGDDSSDGTDGTDGAQPSPYESSIQDAFADSLINSGGIGLAMQLYKAGS